MENLKVWEYLFTSSHIRKIELLHVAYFFKSLHDTSLSNTLLE